MLSEGFPAVDQLSVCTLSHHSACTPAVLFCQLQRTCPRYVYRQLLLPGESQRADHPTGLHDERMQISRALSFHTPLTFVRPVLSNTVFARLRLAQYVQCRQLQSFIRSLT